MEPRTAVYSFKDLLVWKRAYELTLLIYQQTQSFPKDELYGLTSQLRRAAASTTANIAEGWKRKYRNDRSHFLNMTEGSNEEMKCFLMLASDLNILPIDQTNRALALADQIGAMLYGLIRNLKSVS